MAKEFKDVVGEAIEEGTWGEYLKQQFELILLHLPVMPTLSLRRKRGGEVASVQRVKPRPSAAPPTGSQGTVKVINGLRVHDDWNGRGRVVEIDNKYVAQVAVDGKWKCIDRDGEHTWDYSGTTAKWCQCATLSKAKMLVRHGLLTQDTTTALKGMR